jgi:predicted alpha/beta hydrolase family esterase
MNKILLVPGLHNSGPDHWQSRWHQQFPSGRE